MFSTAIFIKVFCLVCLFDVAFLAVMGIYQHRWLLFRLVCAVVLSLAISAFAAIAFS